ncbi:hypothetical protein BGZ63DRAFT_388562 [Mariannaea sp. PMI_226]|nr:hypothetical protein BGZ63DRAFT_388562 [Mariannaea sp. PMI_226]
MDDFVVSREASYMQAASSDGVNHKQRACANCARLKMKCQWPAAGTGRPEKACVRCDRMKLSCKVPEAAPRKKRGKSTRVAQLERKLDGIVELLAASQHVQQRVPSPLTPESPNAGQMQVHAQVPAQLPAPVQLQSQPQEDLGQHPMSQAVPKEPYPFNGVGKLSCHGELLVPDVPFDEAPCLELLPGFRITQLQAAKALDTYRYDLVPVYPFVPLPKNMTARDLYTGSRFLFWTIMSVTIPTSGDVQRNVRAWFRKYLAEHILVRQERRLDILQAILIHLGWNDFPFYLEPQATPILQMAVSLIVDLQLDRSPLCSALAQRTLLGDAWQTVPKSQCGPKMKTVHSLEDKRSVLGYYHLSSLLCVLFRRGIGFPWSNFLAQCADSLLETSEFESDKMLVALVKMHHVAERTFAVMRTTDYLEQVNVVFRAPLDMAINNARRELDNIVKAQPESVKQNKMFWSHYYILVMRLYEPVVWMKAPSISDSDTLSAEPFERTEALWKLVQSISNYYNHQLSIPAVELSTFPVTAGGFGAFTVVTSARLLFLEGSPDWDPSIARRRLDLGDLLKRMSAHYEEAYHTAVNMGRRVRILDDGTTMFLKFSYKTRWIRHWYMGKIPADEQPSHPERTAPEQPQTDTAPGMTAAAAATTEPGTVTEPMPDWATDVQFDESFWQEMLSFTGDLTEIPLTNAMPGV